MNTIVRTVIVGFIAGLAGAYVFARFGEKQEPDNIKYATASLDSPRSYRTLVATRPAPGLAPVDFSEAAAKAIPSVVYVKCTSEGVSYSYWDFLFGEGAQTRITSGSGVIFSPDGYIVTNNHVIEEAEHIEVQYDKKVYPAELIGTDPSTDLAVLKIDEKNLPAIVLGSSTALQVGEWVIAVGNPYSLSSTVTAGIVSAKGRRIGILQDKFPIESFIQTDAAINPGNSGGALVNKSGELVGINTAILSKTGSYTGYAFAVPVDIAKKVVDDLLKYGVVQKAFYGGSVVDYDYEAAKKYNLNTNVGDFHGVLLERMDRSGPVADAGLKPGDVITKINDASVDSQSEFEQILSYHYPGDKVTLTYKRDGNPATATIVLVNKDGGTDMIKREIYSSTTLGAQLEATDYGVKVFKLKSDGLLKGLGVPENFTIISLNRMRVKSAQDVIDFFDKYKGRVLMYGITAAKEEQQFPFILH